MIILNIQQIYLHNLFITKTSKQSPENLIKFQKIDGK